ncbi:MAG: TPM domain-containing protein [Hyphomicrobiaceae bacterium]
MFKQSEEKRIAAAINEAENKTSGEVVAVVAAQSDSYLYIPIMWASIVALFVPWPLIFFTGLSLPAIYITQLIVFLVLLVSLFPKSIRIWLVPPALKRLRAHRHSVEQFLVQDLHTTKSRTGVLIFVSMAERFAAILPDTAIAKKVDKSVWQDAVDVLVKNLGENKPADGFVDAINRVGDELAKHYPPGSEDPNDLPNHLIILE